jgi:hypothetical protein
MVPLVGRIRSISSRIAGAVGRGAGRTSLVQAGASIDPDGVDAMVSQSGLRRRLAFRPCGPDDFFAALRERRPFTCELRYPGESESRTLTQLSVINAPAFGGPLRLNVPASDPDDRLLDILTVDDAPPSRMLLAAVPFLLRSTRPAPGITVRHAASVQVRADAPLEVTLDGEIAGTLPGSFEVSGEALRVITPLRAQRRPGGVGAAGRDHRPGVLLPSVMTLLGERNWYRPRWLSGPWPPQQPRLPRPPEPGQMPGPGAPQRPLSVLWRHEHGTDPSPHPDYRNRPTGQGERHVSIQALRRRARGCGGPDRTGWMRY